MKVDLSRLHEGIDLPETLSNRTGKSRRTAELIGELAESVTESRLRVLQLVRGEIPDIRRSRRRTRTTKLEKILVLRKRADSTRTVDREPPPSPTRHTGNPPIDAPYVVALTVMGLSKMHRNPRKTRILVKPM